MEATQFTDALRTLIAARDSDWEPTTLDEARRLHETLMPELKRLQAHHADQAATFDQAMELADQLAAADTDGERDDVHEQLVYVLGQSVAGYRELGVRPEEETGNPRSSLDGRRRVGLP